MDSTCYFPVEFLSVASEMHWSVIRLLPLDDPRLAEHEMRFRLGRGGSVGCVAAVPVVGPPGDSALDSARARATRALRTLRFALRAHRGINDRQLRFRLGPDYAFEGGRSGWRLPADAAFELTVTPDLAAIAASQPVSALPSEPASDIDKRAALALEWMERAHFAHEPVVSLLFLFFALEALLGDKSEGLKAHALAFRQAMLSHVVTGVSSHPTETWLLYDEVRSAAVHGEHPPAIDTELVTKFAWEVRQAVNHVLSVARERGFHRRGRLLKMLDAHPDRSKLVAWLRVNGGPVWTKYLDADRG